MQDKKYDVLCFGDACLDIIFAGLNKIPVLGTEEYCKDFVLKAGGAANTPMGLAMLGNKTTIATCYGKDYFSKIMTDFISEYKVDKSALQFVEEYRTAVSAVMSTKEDRCFASYGGSGINHYPNNILEEEIAKARHVHTYIGYAKDYTILKHAKSAGATVSLDSSWWEGMRLNDVKHILKECDIFKPNESEAMELCQTDNPKKALDILADFTKMPVISLGSNGAITKVDGKVYECKINKKVEVIDTTGAGDLFFAGLIHSFIRGESPSEMLEFACKCGSKAVTFYGGIDSSFTIENLGR